MNQSVPIEQVVESVLCLDEDAVTDLIGSAVEQNQDLATVLHSGLAVGLCKPGEGFEQGEAFIPEFVTGIRIVQSSLKELEPQIATDLLTSKGTFLIGTVAGDLYDGGVPTSASWAKAINADAYAEDLFSGLRAFW